MAISIGVGVNVHYCRNIKLSTGVTHIILADEDESIFSLFSEGDYFHSVVLDCDMQVAFTQQNLQESSFRSYASTLRESVVVGDHTARKDTENTTDPIPVTVQLQPNAPFLPDFPKLFWRTANGFFTESPMDGSDSEGYTGWIPPQPEDTNVEYYISIDNTAGCSRFLPADAPNTLYLFRVGTDTTPPTITHNYAQLVPLVYLPFTVYAEIDDNLGIDFAQIFYRINGGPEHSLTMNPDEETYSCEIPDSLNIGDIIEYAIYTEDAAQAPNSARSPETGYYRSEIVEKIPALVVDLDASRNSGPVIQQNLQNMDIYTDYTTALPTSLFGYHSVFVCLGIYSSGNHVLTNAEGDILSEYLNAGGNLYMEGGDTWYYDPPTSVHSMFHIDSDSDGSHDAGPIYGVPGTFTENMTFTYPYSENYNYFIDHLIAGTGAQYILRNDSPSYYVGIAYDSGSYRTVGTSIKISGLGDAQLLNKLLDAIATFFGSAHTSPTPTPTGTPPTYTPTQTPTATPPPLTPTPVPPTPTPTSPPPSPTPSPTPDDAPLGVSIRMPSTYFRSGDPFWCKVIINNPESESYLHSFLFVILDVWGQYFFAPGFTDTEPDHYDVDVLPGIQEVEVVPEFAWPEDAGSAQDIRWLAGLTDRAVTTLIGEMDQMSFGWGD